MSEKLVSHNEAEQNHEASRAEAERRTKELLENSKKEAAETKGKTEEQLEELRNEIEKQAISAKEKTNDGVEQEPEASQSYWYSAEYRQQAYRQTLNNVRKHLSRRDKLASKVIHQPLVERVSDIGSKTVARPSGVLAGSIFSFIASFVVYFFSKRYGYDMTYSIFIAAFLGGFVLGIFLEFAFRGFKALMSRN